MPGTVRDMDTAMNQPLSLPPRNSNASEETKLTDILSPERGPGPDWCGRTLPVMPASRGTVGPQRPGWDRHIWGGQRGPDCGDRVQGGR